MSTGEDNMAGKLFPLVKTLRLLRLAKISRFLEAANQTIIQTWRVVRLAVGLLLTSHLLACGYAMLELQFMEDIVEGGMPTNFNSRKPIPWTELEVPQLYPQVSLVVQTRAGVRCECTCARLYGWSLL